MERMPPHRLITTCPVSGQPNARGLRVIMCARFHMNSSAGESNFATSSLTLSLLASAGRTDVARARLTLGLLSGFVLERFKVNSTPEQRLRTVRHQDSAATLGGNQLRSPL